MNSSYIFDTSKYLCYKTIFCVVKLYCLSYRFSVFHLQHIFAFRIHYAHITNTTQWLSLNKSVSVLLDQIQLADYKVQRKQQTSVIVEQHILKLTDTSNYRISKQFFNLYSYFREPMFLQVSMNRDFQKNVNQKVITGKFFLLLF